MGRKNKDLNFSIESESSEYGNIETNFYTEDVKNATLRFKLTYKNTPIDLLETNLTPELNLFHDDGSVWLDESLIVVDPKFSVFQYNIPDNIIEHYGNVDAKLFLRGDTQSIHVANFSFNIEDSGIDSAIAKEISVPMLKDIVRGLLVDGTINLLNDEIKTELFNSANNYITENSELFKGKKGDTGEQGIQGIQGIKGDTGERGAKGDKGDKGEQGIQGIQGIKGDAGTNGTNGSNGADVSTHVTMTLLNGVLAYSDTRKPVYRVIDFGPSQIVSLGGMVKNIAPNALTTIAVIPLRPYVDYFIPSNDSSVTVKVSTGGSVTVQTTTNWSTGRTLTFNGNIVI